MLDEAKLVDAVLSAIDVPLKALRQQIETLSGQIKTLEDRKPLNGKDADPAVIEQQVKDGFATIQNAISLKINESVGIALKDLQVGNEKQISEAIVKLPKPEPGKGVTVEDVAPMIADLVAKEVAKIPVPKDGKGAASAMIDREGCLVLTMTDGASHNLGSVVGKSADPVEVLRMVKEAVDAVPKPKNGMDGFGFDDLTVEFDGERTALLKFVKGEKAKEFPIVLPMVIDRGVFKEGNEYVRGDGVTWGGSFWIAQKQTRQKPGEGDGWRLAVKKGRDGKEVVSLPRDPNKPVKS